MPQVYMPLSGDVTQATKSLTPDERDAIQAFQDLCHEVERIKKHPVASP